MKIWKKVLTSSLSVGLLVGLLAGNVYAEEGREAYTYRVTFSAGAQGEFDSTKGLSISNAGAAVTQDAEKITVTGLAFGDTVSINAQASVSMGQDSKYYVQGVRLSGRDNDTVADSVFTVTEDADYVVAYGIKGNVVSYTVHYQDADGNTLADSETFYGNVGDKPIVAYKYVDGYEPEVLGYTKTLSADEADNEFTFVYDKAPEDTVNTVTQVVPGTTGTTTTPGTADDDEDGTTTTPGTVDDEDEAGTTPDTETEGTSAETEEPTEESEAVEEEPEVEESQIVDLDDEEVPLAGDLAEKPAKAEKAPLVGITALAVVAVVALGITVFFIKKRGLK